LVKSDLIAVRRGLHVVLGTHPTKADHAREKGLAAQLIGATYLNDCCLTSPMQVFTPGMTITQDVSLIPHEHASFVMGCLQHVDPSQQVERNACYRTQKTHVGSLNTTRHVMDSSA